MDKDSSSQDKEYLEHQDIPNNQLNESCTYCEQQYIPHHNQNKQQNHNIQTPNNILQITHQKTESSSCSSDTDSSVQPKNKLRNKLNINNLLTYFVP